jgi:hypothetical protein
MYSPYPMFSPYIQQPMFSQDEAMLQSFTPLMSPVATPTVNFHQLSLRGDVLASPALGPSQDEFEFLAPSAMDHSQGNTSLKDHFAPLTPSQLMQMNKERPPSRRSSKGSTTPSLKPLLPVTPTMRPEDADILAHKSNYQTVVEGYGEAFGIQDNSVSGTIKVKKTSHKEAEQKRRDNLKHHFKIVKQVLPPGRDKNLSKVMILKKGTR